MYDKKRETISIPFTEIWRENYRYLRKKLYKPYAKMLCLRLILFYQKYLSKHTCLYKPTCSQYTLESIHNRGVVLGILLGCWRILRCNPLSKGGIDPASEAWHKKKWLL